MNDNACRRTGSLYPSHISHFEPRGQTRLPRDTNREEINALPAQTKNDVCVFLTKADGRGSEGQMENCFLAVYPLQ